MSETTTGASAFSVEAASWLDNVEGFAIDMDGVLYRGNAPIPGVPEFLDSLRAAGVAFTMATNNSTMNPDQYVRKLAGMSVEVEEGAIVTSGRATATYLRGRYPRGTRAFVVGMAALREAIFGDGYFVEAGRSERDAQVVISGADFELTYDDLRVACLAIRAGADYVATNPDTTFPSEEGIVPGAGAIVAALRASTGVDPVVIGKPSPAVVDACLAIMGTPKARSVILGDRLDTDILAGERAGIRTIMVLTGVSTVAEARETGITPDLIIETLAPLTEYFQRRATARGGA